MQPWKFKKKVSQRAAMSGWQTGTSKLAWEGTGWKTEAMRSIGKPNVSEKLCFELMYKERIIQRVSNRYNLKQNSRRNKKKPSSLFWTGLNWKREAKRCFEGFEKALAISWSEIIFKRVWSWLRMNAGGVPNTCKSNGVVSLRRFRSNHEAT